MNDIIGWLATNNALMIRIGFSAVAVLVVAYVFRLFFMPRDVEKVVTADSMATSSATGSMNIEELAELQTEIDTLKEKVKMIETEKIELQKQLYEQPVTLETATASSPDSVVKVAPQIDPVNRAEGSADSLNKMNVEHGELIEKIQQLEARLAEYEIIAEDIADVGLLKSENAELKLQLEKVVQEVVSLKSDGVTKVVEAQHTSEAVAVVADIIPPEDIVLADAAPEVVHHEVADTSASDAEIDAMLQDSLDSSTPPEAVADSTPQTQLILNSELEVTEEEQAIINDFESFQNRKKG